VREGDPGRLVRPRYVDGDIRRQRASRGLDQAIFELASRQHGVFGRAQLIALGLSAEAIDHRVRAGRLQVVHRGVYGLGPRDRRRDRRLIAARWRPVRITWRQLEEEPAPVGRDLTVMLALAAA
jgi:Transcriptional regulator, AbiEi antitoxin